MSELARVADVSKGTLHKLEAGSGNPTVETLWTLADTLGVSLGNLLDGDGEQLRVVRAGEGTWAGGSGLSGRLIDRLLRKNAVDVFEVEFAEGERREASAHVLGTVEHMFVISGNLLAGPADGAVELGAGDYISFAADEMHVYEAVNGGARVLLLISSVQEANVWREVERDAP